MYPSTSFYISTFNTIKREYGRCQKIESPQERSSKLSNILTDLERIDKSYCPLDKRLSYAFEIEELYLHIIYTAIFISNTPLPKGHEMDPNELLSRYKELKESSGYQALKPQQAKKQKIDEYVARLESGINVKSECYIRQGPLRV